MISRRQLSTLPAEYDEENWPPYRGFVRCIWCEARFDSAEEFLDHNRQACVEARS